MRDNALLSFYLVKLFLNAVLSIEQTRKDTTMKPYEIKALREANTIKEVVAMVDCREFEHNAKDEAAHIQYHLMLQYNNRILDGMPEAAALNHAKASAVHANGGTVAQQTEFWRDADAAMISNMNITKAKQVEQVYDAALRDNLYSKDCYALAIDVAVTLGGNEIDNSNITESCTSKVTFEFDDSSSAQIKYGVSISSDFSYSHSLSEALNK